MKQQTKLESFIEAIVNTLIGFIITFISSYPIYKLCGVEVIGGQMLSVTLIFTAISVLRGYIIRRFFNNLEGIKNFLKRKFGNEAIQGSSKRHTIRWVPQSKQNGDGNDRDFWVSDEI
jgi:hypothetical protein